MQYLFFPLQYGLTPLQLAAFEQKPEMVEFLEEKCANAHAPVEIKGYSFFFSSILVLFLRVTIA